MKNQKNKIAAFTILELMAVLVIISIAALIAIPMFSSAAKTQLRSAANMVAADLEYARSLAISKQQMSRVVFDETNESYRIEDSTSVISHPVQIGKDYEVNFSTDRRVNQVDIVNVDFGSTTQVEFNYLGSPDNGGTIQLAAGSSAMTIAVEPVTGFITISD